MVLNDNENVVKTEFEVEGRRTLKEHEKFMQHRSDDGYDRMGYDSLRMLLQAVNEYKAGESTESMRNKLTLNEHDI